MDFSGTRRAPHNLTRTLTYSLGQNGPFVRFSVLTDYGLVLEPGERLMLIYLLPRCAKLMASDKFMCVHDQKGNRSTKTYGFRSCYTHLTFHTIEFPQSQVSQSNTNSGFTR
jgi:hypothetical protein